MNFELKPAANGATLTLHGRPGVQQARPLWDELIAVVAAGKTIRLNASEVEEIDTSIAQILCRCGSRLQIGEASDGFMASLQLRGLEHFFAQQQQEPAPAEKSESKSESKSRSRRAEKQARRAA